MQILQEFGVTMLAVMVGVLLAGWLSLVAGELVGPATTGATGLAYNIYYRVYGKKKARAQLLGYLRPELDDISDFPDDSVTYSLPVLQSVVEQGAALLLFDEEDRKLILKLHREVTRLAQRLQIREQARLIAQERADLNLVAYQEDIDSAISNVQCSASDLLNKMASDVRGDKST